ncbi:MAG: Uma2 family endonuclease [Bacteroidota bacterium]
MKAHKLPKLTVEEYISQEQESDVKYEYHDGKIYALAGGTINHGMLCGNIFGELRSGLKNKKSNCKPFTSEIKVNIDKTNSYVYPDSMVICGELETSKNEINSVTNPILIVEVLSKSTAEYDRGDKFHLYRQLKSFKEYVLVEQNRYVVDIHYKNDNSDLWRITRYEGLDQIINLQSIGIEILMKDLYSDINLDLPQ